MSKPIGLMWGHPNPKQTFQQFAEEGVEYFVRKYGYYPTELHYRAEDGTVSIPKVQCIAVTSDHQLQTIMMYPAQEHD